MPNYDEYPDYEEQRRVSEELAHNRQKYEDDVTLSIRRCTESVDARRFMYEMLKWCGLFNSVVPEEEKLAHAEGRRLIGIQLKNTLDELDPELFFEILKEGTRYEESICQSKKLSNSLQRT